MAADNENNSVAQPASSVISGGENHQSQPSASTVSNGQDQESLPLSDAASAAPGGEPLSGAGESSALSPEETDLNQLLRRLRAVVQDLRSVLEHVQSGKLILKSQAEYLTSTRDTLAEIRGTLEKTPATNDTIDHLINILGQLEYNPLWAGAQGEIPSQEQTNAIDILLGHVQQIERMVGLLTIPARLNSWLANSSPGYYVPFHLIFMDEIPNEEDRRAVLNQIAWSPAIVNNGLVDVSSGLVFRFAPEAANRWRSVAWVVGTLILSVVIVMGAAFLPIPNWDMNKSGERAAVFAIAWLAVLVGVVAHIGVSQAKRERETNLPTIFAVTSLTKMIDARLGQIIWKLILILLGVFVVIFAIDPSASPVNAFLVGYSLDSIIELFGESTDTKVKSIQSKLTGKG